ncbi:MAG: conjugal transfer protein TraR [Firmicutes bacterium]|nr:conjugal transfer protein TraR [Bacillota bacterium]
MDRRKLEHFKAIIEEQRSRLLDRVEQLDKGLQTSMKDSTGELSSYDNHPADEDTTMYDRERDVGIRGNTIGILQRMDDALERIESGEYGTCENCGRQIEEERLLSIPYTTLCVECQNELEISMPDRFRRPVEEKALGAPFGAHFLRPDTPGIDGEDVWQDVAKYGTSNSPQDIPGSTEFGEVYWNAGEDVGAVEDLDYIIDEGDPDDIPPDPDIYKRE